MDRGSIVRVWLPLLAGFWCLEYIFGSGPGPRDWFRWIGLGLGLAGLAGLIVARYTLGRSFSISPQARELVTRGIYSRIRNPIYVSGVIFAAGIFLMVRNPALWFVLLPIIILQVVRARREARVLEAAFGDAYREYRRRTWF